MNFRTELNVAPSRWKISHTDGILLIGSCFSTNIGEQLQKYKFRCITNPFGTVYNPVSIGRLLEMAGSGVEIGTDSLILSAGIWVHPDFHSSLASPDKNAAADRINLALREVHDKLPDTRYLFITSGTSMAYISKETGDIVANCHKLPASHFDTAIISAEQGAGALTGAISTLRILNPDLRVILTVSPVRHIRDGLAANTRSKARLFGMADILESSDMGVAYFPAYEWVMDDLRDYRFYGPDLIHPNDQAIGYIWEKFSQHFFDEPTTALNDRIGKVLAAREHRPFNADTPAHQAFIARLKEETDTLESMYSWLRF